MEARLGAPYSTFPLYHMNALCVTLFAFGAGASEVLLPEFNAKRYARPTKVELWVNKEREPRVVELLDSLDRKTQVALGKTMSIRRLVLRVVETRRGQSGLSTGFAEVEGVMLR